MEKKEPDIQQASIILPHFDYEVPVLYVEEGTPYIPVIALCKMLGLRASSHIPRWRRLILWGSARKLLCRMPDGRRRKVWCLHMGALSFWFSCFDWSLVLPERHAQLQQATDEWMDLLDGAHRAMIVQYKAKRRLIFKFLTVYSDVDVALSHFSPSHHVYLDDFELCREWEELISQGRILIGEAVTCARRMLHEQDSMPIIDVVSLNTDNEITDEFSMPLFPIVKKVDNACFLDCFAQLTQWHGQLLDFLGTHGILWDEEQKRWYLASSGSQNL